MKRPADVLVERMNDVLTPLLVGLGQRNYA